MIFILQLKFENEKKKNEKKKFYQIKRQKEKNTYNKSLV